VQQDGAAAGLAKWAERSPADLAPWILLPRRSYLHLLKPAGGRVSVVAQHRGGPLGGLRSVVRACRPGHVGLSTWRLDGIQVLRHLGGVAPLAGDYLTGLVRVGAACGTNASAAAGLVSALR
jgi:hypothetical protein